MKIWGITDVGLVRKENQDAYAVESRDGFDICAVCDGMGGAAAGKLASEIAVRTYMEALWETLTEGMDLDAVQSAMAAAALVFLHGGSEAQMANAVAIALKNLMGLICDPVAGLVEVPCVKRNAIGAMNALTAAELSLAGISSAIPVDEVIDAMRRVGDMMSSDVKETGNGGVAASKTGKAFRKSFFGGEG